jgi:hypothetical protein
MILKCLFICVANNKSLILHNIFTNSMVFGEDVIQTAEDLELAAIAASYIIFNGGLREKYQSSVCV